MANRDPNDDGRPWGWIVDGVWREIPKIPLVLANLGPPPFDVTLAESGEVRHIIHNPDEVEVIVIAPSDDDQPQEAVILPPAIEEPALPFRLVRAEGDTDEGHEITCMDIAAALHVPWPLP